MQPKLQFNIDNSEAPPEKKRKRGRPKKKAYARNEVQLPSVPTKHRCCCCSFSLSDVWIYDTPCPEDGTAMCWDIEKTFVRDPPDMYRFAVPVGV